LQNFTQKDLTEVTIFQKVLVGLLEIPRMLIHHFLHVINLTIQHLIQSNSTDKYGLNRSQEIHYTTYRSSTLAERPCIVLCSISSKKLS